MKDWKKWDDEAILELTEYHGMGLPYREIAEIMERGIDSIKQQCAKMITEGSIGRRIPTPATDLVQREIVDTPLLELVSRYKTMKLYEANLLKDKLPPVKRIVKEYGSWSEAKILAGQTPSTGAVLPGDPSVLYLVYFEEGFYKIGITSRSIKERFRGYPKFKVVECCPMTWKEARAAERFLLKKYEAGTVQTDNKAIRESGITECFYCDEVPELII